MNHTRQTVDTLLRNVRPPEFINDRHQDELRLRLQSIPAAETPPARRPRTVAAYALAAAVVIALVLSASLLTTKSVWAQAISAMERVQTAVVTFRFLPSDGAEHRAFVQAPDRFALVGPDRKAWFNESEALVYDPGLNRVTRMDLPKNVLGQWLDMFSSGNFSSRLFAPQYDHETDHGVVSFEGRSLRYIEVWDSHDPTDKQEFYLEPDTLLPVVQITLRRDEEGAAWRQALRADYAFNVPVDPQVFVPDYPSTAKVVQEEPPSTSASAQAAEWQESALAIARHGDKYLAITDMWVGETGWVGIKVRSNLFSVLECPLDVKGLPEFLGDPVNRQRWGVDERTLRQYLWGAQLTSDEGTVYLARNGAAQSPQKAMTGDKEFSQFYLPYPEPTDVTYPKTLKFRFLTIVTDKGRGETWDHYQDWRTDPEKYQLFELTVPAPAPSILPPAEFEEWALSSALQDIVSALNNSGRRAEAYERYHGLPEEELLPLGVTWLIILDNLGKTQEKTAFFEKYEPYAIEKWGDKAEELGNLKICREIVGRTPKP